MLRHIEARHFQAWHFLARGADLPEDETLTGGFLTAEQARAVIRKIKRTRSEKARRAAEIDEAIQEAKALEMAGQPAAKAIQPVKRVIERDTGAIMLPALLSLQDALNRMAWIDQQVAMLNTRRMDDAAAVLLLMDW